MRVLSAETHTPRKEPETTTTTLCTIGVKNFPCEQCGKMFGRSSALHVHMTKIHPHAIVKEGERKLEIPATYPALSMIPAPAADSDREPHPHPP